MVVESIGVYIFIIVVLFAIALWGWHKWSETKKRRSSEYFYSGLLKLIRGDRRGALVDLKHAAQESSDNITSYILIGDILREEKKPAKALQVHKSITIRSDIKESEKADAYKSLILDQIALGMHKDALQTAKKLLSVRKDDWAVNIYLEELEANENWEEGINFLSKLPKTERRDKLLSFYEVELGKKFVSEGENRKGRIHFKEAIKLNKECYPAYIEIGEAYVKDERIDDAIAWWTNFSAQFPDKAYLVIEPLEKAFYDRGKFQQVVNFYETLINEGKSSREIFFALSNIYVKMGDYASAISTLERLDAKNREDKIQLMYLYFQNQQFDKIEGLIKEIYEETISAKRKFICKSCGYESERPLWRCPGCNEWDSFNI
ncbi:tetratricopeptide repeat protein [bacterium]|nr:tetratricopeptide repeat protein [bacterium]